MDKIIIQVLKNNIQEYKYNIEVFTQVEIALAKEAITLTEDEMYLLQRHPTSFKKDYEFMLENEVRQLIMLEGV